jgi:hypothetical protein
MTFKELVVHARERDTKLLVEAIDSRKIEGLIVFPEPSLRHATGELAYAPDGLKLPLRTDLAYQGLEGDMRTEHAVSRTTAFREPIFAEWENQLKIEIRSIAWSELVLTCIPHNAQCDWSGVRDWFLRWFDCNDEKVPDEMGLAGVVHFISDPKVLAEGTRFEVDLGSAPIEAIGDLFDEIARLGFERCVVGEQADAENFVVKK